MDGTPPEARMADGISRKVRGAESMAEETELSELARVQVERARAFAVANGHVIGRLLSCRRQEHNWQVLADRMIGAHGERVRDMVARASAQLARVRWLVTFEGPTPAGPEHTEAWYLVTEDDGEVEWRGNG
jgi:hypothetical protein